MSTTLTEATTPEVPAESTPVKPKPARRTPAKKKPAPRRTSSPSVPADVKKEERKAELDRIRRAAAFQREQEEAERDEWRREAKAKKREHSKVLNAKRWKAFAARAVPYTPLALVNTVAMGGQFDWAVKNLTIGEPYSFLRFLAAGIYAAGAESIALFLQYYANRALRNGDAAGALYLAAFGVAGVVAYVNFSHYAIHPKDGLPQPTAMAVIVAMCSLLSPWLWRIHSRAEYRDVLKERGEIDARLVRLDMARKVFHPIRSFMILWYASWERVSTPAEAVALYERKQAEKVEARRTKELAKAAKTPAPAPVIKAEQVPNPKPINQAPAPAPARERKTGGRDFSGHSKWKEGCAIFESALDSGTRMTVAELAAALGQRNKNLAIAIRNFVEDRRASEARARQAATS